MKKKEPPIRVPFDTAQDVGLSLAAKGLLLVSLSIGGRLPPTEMLVHPSEVDVARHAFKELMALGYISKGEGDSRESYSVHPAPLTEKPARKLTVQQQFIKDACEVWNERRRSDWPPVDVKKPGTRLIKYLQELLKAHDGDPHDALQTVALGIEWIAKREDWAEGKMFTFDQIAAKNKLESNASKARTFLKGVSEAKGAAGRGLNPGDQCMWQGSVPVSIVRDVDGNGHHYVVKGQPGAASYEGIEWEVAAHDLRPVGYTRGVVKA